MCKKPRKFSQVKTELGFLVQEGKGLEGMHPPTRGGALHRANTISLHSHDDGVKVRQLQKQNRTSVKSPAPPLKNGDKPRSPNTVKLSSPVALKKLFE